MPTGKAHYTLTIPINAAISSSVALGHFEAPQFAVQTPSAWTTADLAIEVSLDDTTWYRVRDAAGAVVKVAGIQVAQAGVYMLPAGAVAALGYNYIRVVSINTSTGTNENQLAERTLKLVTLP